ncbi:MAG: hypothetical protein HY303_01600 [Candidatus Wallbacteria bacterium]|nr:hypothetical protein [Candidatus Wallbacteria bacterium]
MFNIRKLLTIGALALTLSASVFARTTAEFPYREIENWRHEGMTFVIRDAQGHIVQHAKGYLEKWKSEQQQIWVVRDSEGRFLTYMHGQIERWSDGSMRLVLRNKDGKFVAVGSVCFLNGKAVLMSLEMVDQTLDRAA